jgi:glucoamylase
MIMVYCKLKTAIIKKWMHLLGVFFLTLYGLLIAPSALGQSLSESKTRIWLKENGSFSLDKILENISPTDGAPGAIIAAKSKSNPNYYYHWVRDAGLTVDSMINMYRSSTSNLKQQELISEKIFEYLEFSTNIQKLKTLSDLGEPKFNVDGTTFNDPWGRPQNDGPAMRAISLIHWANVLISEGKESIVRQKMYDSKLPATSPIKMDLEYVSHHWKDPSYDIWEEVKGTHFYTLMIERRSLLEGSALAHKLGDEGAAEWYSIQGKEIEIELQKFWDPKQGFIVATINRVDGIDYKSSNIDTAVILGLLHGDIKDGFFSWDDKRVIATIEKIIGAFSDIYPINHRQEIPGIAIGRYPEDRYSGTNLNGGNPWPLCTLAVADAFYRYAEILSKKGEYQKAIEISTRADEFVERVRYHANKDGSLSEQMDRYTGYMTSASDLTWNYASLLIVRNTIMES